MRAVERKAILDSIAKRTDLSPAGKRKVLKNLGVDAEYQPHQGKREMERRIAKSMQRYVDEGQKVGLLK